MNTRRKLSLTAVCVVVLVAITVYGVWREIQKDIVLACVASIHKSLDSMRSSELGLTPDALSLEWTALDAKSDRLVLAAYQTGSLDCRKRESSGLPIDAWNNHFQVAVRRPKEATGVEFLVWSNGSDRVAGTSDDIVSPRGESASSLISSLLIPVACCEIGKPMVLLGGRVTVRF